MIFDFTPLDEDTVLKIQEIEMERAICRRKEALQLFYTLRSGLSSGPVCTDCQ
jgi:hypothetical protein